MARRSPRRAAGGFTLIEIMVVMLIAGIALAVAAPATGMLDQSRQDEATEQLRLALEHAVFDSVLAGNELAFASTGAAYHFELRGDEGDWLAAPADGPLRARALPDAVRIEAIWLDGQALPAGARLRFAGGAPPLFRLRLRSGARQLELRSSAAGAVRRLAVEEAGHGR